MPRNDQGVSADRYAIIPRCLIFITRGEQVLLIKGAAKKRLWAGRYNGVGGHVERGEDILSAARRELAEETELACPDLRLCGTITVDTGDERGIGIYVFTGESPAGEPVSSAEGELEWVARSRLGDLVMVEDLPVILPKVLGMSPGQNPFSAHYRYDDQDQLVITFADS
jgi:8-oxo-dGTP diphosphatase